MCWESFIPKWRGTFVVGRIVSCPGVVLVPVGGLWRRPAAHEGHGQVFPRSLCWGCGVGRVLSRKCRWKGGVGRTFSRRPVLRPGLVAMWHTSCSCSCSCSWGVAPCEALLRRVGALDGVILPDWWRRGRNLRTCNAQVADHLGEKRGRRAGRGEVVCVLGATVSGVVH